MDAPETANAKAKNPGARHKFLTELGPLLVFFIVNWFEGILAATGAFMVAMVLALGWSWHATRHIPVMLWVSTALVLVFGGLTLYLDDALFIKIKPTVIYCLFAVILLTGLWRGRLFLKTVMGPAFPPIRDTGWRILTRNWSLFFISMAGLNEFVWRSFSTDSWVAFKTFGAIPIVLLFSIAQTPVLLRHQIEGDDG